MDEPASPRTAETPPTRAREASRSGTIKASLHLLVLFGLGTIRSGRRAGRCSRALLS